MGCPGTGTLPSGKDFVSQMLFSVRISHLAGFFDAMKNSSLMLGTFQLFFSKIFKPIYSLYLFDAVRSAGLSKVVLC